MQAQIKRRRVPALGWPPALKALPVPPERVSVWLRVTAAARPDDLVGFLRELAAPDFAIESCRESARLTPVQSDRYSAHWNCRFLTSNHDPFAGIRLLKRLTEAGFHILRFDGAGETLGG